MSAPKKSQRRRHIPQRTCVGCRQTTSKQAMIRVVRGAEGIMIDQSGKAPGRGAYLHLKRSCWEKALKGSLAKSLRTTLQETEVASLLASLNEMTDEDLD